MNLIKLKKSWRKFIVISYSDYLILKSNFDLSKKVNKSYFSKNTYKLENIPDLKRLLNDNILKCFIIKINYKEDNKNTLELIDEMFFIDKFLIDNPNSI